MPLLLPPFPLPLFRLLFRVVGPLSLLRRTGSLSVTTLPGSETTRLEAGRRTTFTFYEDIKLVLLLLLLLLIMN